MPAKPARTSPQARKIADTAVSDASGSDITTVDQVNQAPWVAYPKRGFEASLDRICPRVKIGGKPVFVKVSATRWAADTGRPVVSFAYKVARELQSDSGVQITHKLVAQLSVAAYNDSLKTRLSAADIETLVTSGEDGVTSSRFKAVSKKYPAINAVLQSLF